MAKFKILTVTKEAIDGYFDSLENMPLVVTQEEEQLLQALREKSIDPQTIIDYILSLDQK